MKATLEELSMQLWKDIVIYLIWLLNQSPGLDVQKKTSTQADWALLWATNANTKATLYVLTTPSKSSHQLSHNTIQKILKRASKAKWNP